MFLGWIDADCGLFYYLGRYGDVLMDRGFLEQQK